MAQGLKFMFDRRFDLPEGSVSTNVAEVVSSVLEEMNKPDIEENTNILNEEAETPPPPVEPEPEPEITYSEEAMEEIKADAFNKGVEKGINDASLMREEVVKATLLTIADTVGQVLDRQATFEKEKEAEMMKLCLAICQKVLPSLLTEKGLEEIKSLLDKSLPDLHVEEHISVRVSPLNEKPIKDYIKKFLSDNGIESAVVIIKDETLGQADCVIEWFGGSIERRTEEIIKDIENIVNSYTEKAQEETSLQNAKKTTETEENLPKNDEKDKKEIKDSKDKLEKVPTNSDDKEEKDTEEKVAPIVGAELDELKVETGAVETDNEEANLSELEADAEEIEQKE